MRAIMREKDSGISKTVTTRTSSGADGNGDPKTINDLQFTSGAERRFMVGQNIPNFRARVARGDLLPHTRFYQAEWKAEYGGGSFYSSSKTDESWTSHTNWQGNPDVTTTAWRVPDFTPDHDCFFPHVPDLSGASYAVQSAAERIYTEGFDLLTSAGEMGQTLSMMRKLLTTLRRIISNPATLALNPREIASAYLELRYGWRTFVYDLQDLYEAVQQQNDGVWTRSQRVGLSTDDNGNSWIVGPTPVKVGNLKYTLLKEWTNKASIRGSVTGRIEPPRFMVNPVITAWELIPLSFVLDWVYDVGTALGAMMFEAYNVGYSASVGYHSDSVITYTLTGEGTYSHAGSASCVYIYSSSVQSRTPTEIPLAPRFNPKPLDVWKQLDLLALARTRMLLK